MKNIALMLSCAFLLCLMSCGGEKASSPVKKEKASLASPNANETAKTKAVSEPVAEAKEEATEEVPTDPIPPEQIEKAKAIIAAVSEEEIAAVDAKKKFKMLCAACHGFKGNLKVNGAKDLTKSKISLEESVAQVYHGRGLMTPFKGLMSDAEIVAVAQYIKKELRK